MKFFILFSVLGTCLGFQSKITVFTTNPTNKVCRQCIRFERKIVGLEKEFPELDFQRFDILETPENKDVARANDIRRVPMIIFETPSETSRFLGTAINYDRIEDKCRQLVSFEKLTSPHSSSEKIRSIRNMGLVTEEHRLLSTYCRDIYDDEFLSNCDDYIENKSTDVQVGIIEKDDTIFICFRGSDHPTDWRFNFFMSMTEYPFRTGKYVHSGFLTQWMSIKQQLEQKIRFMLTRKGINRVVFTGHSAGTTCALAAHDMVDELREKYKVDVNVVTFGSPRVCNGKFKDDFEKRVSCTRIVLDRDVITRVPFSIFGYCHLGKPIQLRDAEVLDRDTNTLESVSWVVLGLPKGDIGVRDHFITNYVEAIDKILNS